MLHMVSVYAMLSEFPGAKHMTSAHLTRLANLLSKASKGQHGKDISITIREAARLLSAQICQQNLLS